MGKNERGDDGGIGFNDVFWGLHAEFAPSDFFIGDSATVTTIACGRIANLTKVAPKRNFITLEVLMKHGHDADWEISGDTTADLKHAEGALSGSSRIIFREPGHVFNARANGVDFFYVAANDSGGVHVAESGVFPAGHNNREIFFGSGEHPGIFRVDLIIFFVFATAEDLVKKFVREITFALFVGGSPDFEHGFFHAAH